MSGRGRDRFGPGVRPTTRKVFEALFQILDGMLGGLNGLAVLDVFAGSGQLGLEALRLGAATLVLLEKEPGVAASLRHAIRDAGFGPGQASVIRGDALRSLERVAGAFDLVIMDPPYSQDLGAGALEIVARRNLLREGGTCVIEHHHKDRLPERVGDLAQVRTRDYGETRLSFYARVPLEGDPSA